MLKKLARTVGGPKLFMDRASNNKEEHSEHMVRGS